MATDHTTTIFATELILLLFFGRMFGEAMSRVGQPAIFGQLLAGVVLGPTVFGALMPEWRNAIFPGTPALKSMIDAISQIGILLLLLLTGMKTNLSLVNRKLLFQDGAYRPAANAWKVLVRSAATVFVLEERFRFGDRRCHSVVATRMQAISDFRNGTEIYGRAVCHDIGPLQYIRFNMANIPIGNDKYYPTAFRDVCDIVIVTFNNAGKAIKHRAGGRKFGLSELR